jgi:peptidyl-dipeptidase Dcp
MSKTLVAGAGLAALLAAGPAGAGAAAEAAVANPLLSQWTGPFGGVPPFDRVEIGQFQPALEAGMAQALAEVEAIVAAAAPPTFENTIAALERSGRTLTRVGTVYGVYGATMSSPAFQAVEREMEPRLAAFQDRIYQDQRLFRRVDAVYQARERSGLTPEQQRLTWVYHTRLVRAGARLDDPGRRRVAAINERLAALFTTFNQNVLAEENDQLTLIDRPADLAGLPPSLVAAAAAAAAERGHPGKWAILNTRSSAEPFLTYSDRRDLREKVWRTFTTRGDHGDARDNGKVIAEILRLRAERARLLGYPTHAHYRLENTMARTPERALALMEAVWKPAVARVREEVADMQAIADREGAGIRIEPWDYRYYAEKVRKGRYDLDEGQLKPYLQLEKLREGMFWVAGRLYGFQFSPASNVPVCHPDVRVWQVKDASGRELGLWYFDPFARPGKRSGAWMNAYRSQERFDGEVATLVSNNANFVKGKPGEPVLVSWDDALTLFHEFGHALHGLASSVSYPTVSGTAVARDFVEFPSQLLERWLSTPEVLDRFALHAETGRPIPAELVRKVERASRFNQGFITVEYLAAALVDMKLHLAGGADIDPAAFERDTLQALGMPREIAMRHRTPHFGHVFSSDAYSAGYYSYLWSDTLSADAWEAFSEAGGPFDPAVARRLLHLLAAGNTVDPADAYRAFRGRDPGIAALMRHRGFPVPAPPGPAAPAKTAPAAPAR